MPPSSLQLQDHLKAWESYLNIKDFDVLAQSAVVHAQFELLHPFKDGNGHIGRLLIPLFLYSKKRLTRPMFYLSDYLEQNRSEYDARLKAISAEGDWTGWIVFYLKAVVEQAKVNNSKTREIMALYEKTKKQISDITHSQHSMRLVDAFFDRPIFTTSMLDFDIPKATLHNLMRQLEKAEIIMIVRESAGRKPALYAFTELLNAVEGKVVFRPRRK